MHRRSSESTSLGAAWPWPGRDRSLDTVVRAVKWAYTLCPARELVADRDKPAAGSVRAREISPALRALLMAKKPQCPSVFRLCEYSSLHVLLSDCCF